MFAAHCNGSSFQGPESSILQNMALLLFSWMSVRRRAVGFVSVRRSRVFCFPAKEMNHEERLGKSPFTGLPNVKGTVAEDARITDSPPRSEPVLEIRVRPRAGMLRCSRCGRRCRGHDQGGGVRRRGRFRAVGRAGQPVHTRFRIGTRVADERREPEDRKRFSARRVARRRKTPPIGSPNG